MAKKKVTYICEVCGQEHVDEAYAIKCENLHYKAVCIKGCEYAKEKKEYPESISVTMRNGNGNEKVIIFYRKLNNC